MSVVKSKGKLKIALIRRILRKHCLREFIAIYAYVRKERSQTNDLTFHHVTLGKRTNEIQTKLRKVIKIRL